MSVRIFQSGRDSPTGSIAWYSRWIRRSVLTKVPSFSSEAAAGSTTSANSHVREKNSSDTTRKSSFSSASWT